MRKRGQIYILAALMLGIVIYGLSTVVNLVQQEEIKGDFESLSSNYEVESSKLINSVLQSGGNVADSFANFTFLFTSYSKTKSPSFNLFYALVYGNNLYVGNFMDEEMGIYKECPVGDNPGHDIILLGCLSDISARISFEGLSVETELDFTELKSKCVAALLIDDEEEFCIEIGGIMYKLEIEPNVPKIFSLSRLESGNHILSSIQGDVGEEQICSEKNKGQCKKSFEFCCWSEEDDCLEGSCPEELETECGNGICESDAGENCDPDNCPQDCPCENICEEGRCIKEECNPEGEPCGIGLPDCCPGHWCPTFEPDPKCQEFSWH